MGSQNWPMSYSLLALGLEGDHLSLETITNQSDHCSEKEVLRTTWGQRRATCLIWEFMDGFRGQVITKLRPVGSVKSNQWGELGKSVSRKWNGTCHKSEVRGQFTIPRLETERSSRSLDWREPGGKEVKMESTCIEWLIRREMKGQ